MKTRTANHIAGFTLIEVMVVSCIASLAMVITAPALVSARAKARADTCQDRLREIGLACHNYHDVYRQFPPAWCARYYEANSREWLGWQTALLPFLDQVGLFHDLSNGMRGGMLAAPEWPEDLARRTRTLAEYRCPADNSGDLNAVRGGFGTSNYSGNFGAAPFPRISDGTLEASWPGGVPTPVMIDLAADPGAPEYPKNVGIFRVNGSAAIRNIQDGSSNTIMIAERGVASGAGLWMGVRSNRTENDAVTEFSHRSRINRSLTGASSVHANDGVYIALCDGSVRFLSATIESNPPGSGSRGLLQNLAGRNDGQAIGQF